MTVDMGTPVESGRDLVAAGERLGLYEVLSQSPLTAAELAWRADAGARFVSDWLVAQLEEGYLTFDASTGRYANYCGLLQAG